jgi:6-phosphogluconolactonase (cycloisomerase 2 family)
MTPAKFFLAASLILTLALGLEGCGISGCSTATPGSSGGPSSGSGGGSSPPPGACSLPGGPGGGSEQRVFVYLIDDNAGEIAAEGLNINSAGSFAPVSNFVPPPALGFVNDGGMVVVNQKYLYLPLSNVSVGSVYGYSIDGTTGALSLLNNAPYPVNGLQGTGSSFSIAADPAGKFVFVGDAAGITVFAVNANDGSLTAVPGPPVSTGIGAPMQMATDGLGKYLYALDGVSIAEFSYNSAGLLTSLGTVTSSSSDLVMMSGEPSGKWMLGVRDQAGAGGGALDFNVYVYSINSTGVLASQTPFSTPFPPASLVVSPNDKFVYTFNEDDTSTSGTFLQPIVGLTFDSSTGILQTPVTFPDVLSKIGHIDQSGQTIIVIGQSSATAAAGTIPITILSDGTLSASSQHAGGSFNNFVVTDAP